MANKPPYSICTALLQVTGETWTGTDQSRLKLLRKILEESERSDVLLLPGGFFCNARKPEKYRSWVEEKVVPIIQELAPATVVVFGIDVRNETEENEHQLAYAVSKTKVLAIGRKFMPQEGMQSALSAWELEDGFSRTFLKKGKRYYLAVCYDSFGLRKQKIEQEREVHVILNTIHYFQEAGKGLSGNTYFARHGLAGAALHWRCPVFGAAHFHNRKIPNRWPSGVKWKKGLEGTTTTWKYTDNGLKQSKSHTAEDGCFQLNYFRI